MIVIMKTKLLVFHIEVIIKFLIVIIYQKITKKII